MHYLPVAMLPIGLAYSYTTGFTPLLLPVLFLLVSIVTYYLYAKDKAAAQRSEWRVPEKTLHLNSLLCGWPGAIIAQQRLRHKTQKRSFRAVFWLTVITNIAAVGWLHTRDGNAYLYDRVVQFESLLLNTVTDRHASNLIRALTGFNRASVSYIGRAQ